MQRDSPCSKPRHTLSKSRRICSLLADLLEALADVWDVIVATFLRLSATTLSGEGLSKALQVHHAVWAELADDARQQLLQLLRLAVARHNESVGLHSSLHLWVHEVDDGAVLLEHVDLLDARNLVAAQALQLRLHLLVIGGVSRRLLLGSSGSACTASTGVTQLGLQLGASGQHFRFSWLHGFFE